VDLRGQKQAAVGRRWQPDMNIFENKNHNGMIYNGSKPVRVVQEPSDTKDKSYGGTNRAWYDRIDVRNLANRDGQ
jgi:hypothetical protein